MKVLAVLFIVFAAFTAEERRITIDAGKVQKDLSHSYLGANSHMFQSWYSMKKMMDQGPVFSAFLSNIGSPVLRMMGMGGYGWFSKTEFEKLLEAGAMARVFARIKPEDAPDRKGFQPKDYEAIVKKYAIKSAPTEFITKKNPPDVSWFSIDDFHRFCRSNGIRIIGEFNAVKYYDDDTGIVHTIIDSPEHFDGGVKAAVKKLSWVLKNGYKDLYAGWEIGNECYSEWDPERYAEYARKLIQAVTALQPGIELAVPAMLRDTDDAHIQRFMAASPDRKKWFNWHETMFPALGEDLKKVTHLQVHVYGSASQYNANYRGLQVISNILAQFPNASHLRYMVTEWRYTGVGGTNHRTFRTGALWNAKFAMTLLSYPRVDIATAHEFVCTSGLGYWTPGKGNAGPYEDGSEWVFQKLDDKGKELRSRDGLPHFDIGPFGPVNRMLNTLVTECPVLLEHASDLGAMSSALYADGSGQPVVDEDKTDLEWFICTTKDRSKIGGFIVNTRAQPIALALSAGAARISIQQTEQMTCDADKQTLAEIPGEEKFWRVGTAAVEGGKIMLPANSITSFRGGVHR